MRVSPDPNFPALDTGINAGGDIHVAVIYNVDEVRQHLASFAPTWPRGQMVFPYEGTTITHVPNEGYDLQAPDGTVFYMRLAEQLGKIHFYLASERPVRCLQYQ